MAIKAKYKIKTGDNIYEIFHFETTADQVITTTSKQFVSDTEKASWNDKYTKIEIDRKVTTLNDSIDLKANKTHSHIIADVTSLSDVLATKESTTVVNSKIATAKTQAVTEAATDATNKATEALNEAKSYALAKKTEAITDSNNYTNIKIIEITNNAPTSLNTLGKISTALNDDPSFYATMSNQISNKLDTSAYIIDKDATNLRLNIIQGDKTVEGSINNAMQDAKDYAASLSYAGGGETAELINRIDKMEDISEPGSLAYKIAATETNLLSKANVNEVYLKSDTYSNNEINEIINNIHCVSATQPINPQVTKIWLESSS